MVSAKNIKKLKCPRCNSENTVGIIESARDDNTRYKKICFYCSYCLTEFDDKGVRLFNTEGNFLGYTV